jgi:hypothetical protein
MCGDPATTREHAPPRCFFPGKGAGLQLATVPSCDRHNGKKSGDDMYVLAHICLNAARYGNLAERVFLRSVAPQVIEMAKFHALLADGSKPMGEAGVAYRVNVARFDSFFDHLSAAMYRARFGEGYAYGLRPMRHAYFNFKSSDPQEQQEFAAAGVVQKQFFSAFAPQIVTYCSAKVDESVYQLQIAAPLGPRHRMTFIHNFYGIFEVATLVPAYPPS